MGPMAYNYAERDMLRDFVLFCIWWTVWVFTNVSRDMHYCVIITQAVCVQGTIKKKMES